MKLVFKQILALVLVGAIILSCQLSVWAENVTEPESVPTITESTETEDETVQEEEVESAVVEPVEKAKEKTVLYVALNGNDSNPGTIDKPLSSIIGARDKIRALKENNELAEGGAIVYVREGNYVINESVIFGARDSGTAEAPIIYRNYPDEKVSFVGGAYLNPDDFKPVKDKAVLDRIVDKEARDHVVSIDLHALGYKNLQEPAWEGTYSYYQIGSYLTEKFGVVVPTEKSSELVINNKGMTLARYPNEGFMTINEVIRSGNWKEMDEPMSIKVSDPRVKNWTKADKAILSGTFFYSWASLATALDPTDVAENIIKSKYPIFYGAAAGQQFFIHNLIEEIDVPGEYFVDTETGILYLYPPEEGLREVIYTLLKDEMFVFEDSSFITLEGFGLKFTRKNFVEFDVGSSNNKLINCEVTFNAGGEAAVVLNGNDNIIYDCYFHDCAVGVLCASGDRPTLTRCNNLVENCKFERCDRLNKTYSPALYGYQCVGFKAYHNEISEAEHLVIQFGGNFNDISNNEIYNACMNTDDMGAIYTGRNLTHRGNILSNNYLHDIGRDERGSIGCFGMYFDDFWEAADVVGNVFENITGPGVYCSGSYNVIENNIFANVGKVQDASVALLLSYTYGMDRDFSAHINGIEEMPIHSDVWVEAFPEIVNVIDEEGKLDVNNNIVLKNNVFFDSPRPRVSNTIKPTLKEANNVFYEKDPGFYDLKNRNYLLKEDSVVYTDIPEFEPIAFTRIGRYHDRAVSRAKKGFVFCTDSPYIYKKGEKVKTDKNQAIVENETIYVPLRTGIESVDATLAYDEATGTINISGAGKVIEFIDGTTDKINVNGSEYNLSKPMFNIDSSNYISLVDVANLFGKTLIRYNDLTIITDIKNLFNLEADGNLLRWLEEQLSVY